MLYILQEVRLMITRTALYGKRLNGWLKTRVQGTFGPDGVSTSVNIKWHNGAYPLRTYLYYTHRCVTTSCREYD